MQRTSTRAFALAVGLIVLALVAMYLVPQASAQTGPGWVTLLDGKNMGDWNRGGETNWRLEDGAVVADNRTSKGAAYLVSKNSYKDFQIYVESGPATTPTEPAASGIPTRSPPRGGKSPLCSTARRPRTPQRHVHRRAIRAATRRGRDQVPQGRGQAAVAGEATRPWHRYPAVPGHRSRWWRRYPLEEGVEIGDRK
jgi:hypothetical protein